MGATELPPVQTRGRRLRRTNELNSRANLIWSIAERGDYKQSEFGRVIPPLVGMRRLDQALEGTKQTMLDKVTDLERMGVQNTDRPLPVAGGLQFYSRSRLSFPQFLNDPDQTAVNLSVYFDGFSSLGQECSTGSASSSRELSTRTTTRTPRGPK